MFAKGFKSQTQLSVRTVWTAWTALSISAVMGAPLAFADTGSEIHSYCGDVLSQKSPSASPSPTSVDTASVTREQKRQYCEAAISSHEASNADSAAWKVWAGVATVCTYACVASLVGGPTSEYVCMGVTVAGGVTDAIITKNFVSALTSLGTVGVGYAVNQQMNSSAAEESGKPKKDIGACINAATGALQSFVKFSSMENNEAAAKSNLESARKVAETQAASVTASNYQIQSAQTANALASGNAAQNGSNSASYSDGSSSSDTASTCSSARSGDNGAVLQCAVASDRNLPGFVSSPKFVKEFQKDTGSSLDSFLSKADRPGPLMAGAMGNGLSPTQGAKLASALSDMESRMPSFEMPSTMYAAGGTGGNSGSSEDPMNGLQQMLSGLADQMNPKKKEDLKTGVNAVIFANQTRSPASVVEDRKLNIFDRITYRYYYVGRRILTEGTGEITK